MELQVKRENPVQEDPQELRYVFIYIVFIICVQIRIKFYCYECSLNFAVFIVMQGDKGPVGDQGLSGADGPQGKAGIRGADGAPGVSGAPGESGLDGPQGSKGARGPPGPAVRHQYNKSQTVDYLINIITHATMIVFVYTCRDLLVLWAHQELT